MAGLSDLFNDPGFQRGLTLLAASRPMTEQARAGLLNFDSDQKERELKIGLLQYQMEQAKAQQTAAAQKAALDRQRQQNVDGILGAGFLGGGQRPNAGATPSAGVVSSLTPDQLAALKMNGVDLTTIWDKARPDMQVSNGYAYDKNRIGAGFMPSLQTTPDGKSVMTRIGPDGLPVISVPDGALGAFNAFQGAQQKAQADWTPQEVVAPDGSKVIRSRSQVLGGYATEPQMKASAAGDMGASAATYDKDIADIRKALATPGLDESSRNMLTRELQNRVRQKAQYFPQAEAGNVVELSPQQQAANEAERVRLVKQAEADVVPTQQRQSALARFDQISSTIDSVLSHPGRPTATGLSGLVDPRNYIPGTNATDFRTKADQLGGQAFLSAFESLKGGGQITEVEGKKATDAIASLSRAQSDKQYEKSLREFKSVIDAARARMDGAPAESQPPKFKVAPSDADIRNTALKYGMTVEQVKQKLGL